ncbi:hybrid sensor histidine kinase/response regulator [Kaistia dalseonensis]|uniref:histidine kinase n=1 Tax=Kaistia dalseonensis TaxID=410840 RepID=A0ABU0H1S8_9HYPH|nr:hybrid sensor histidine kinase/response regulator [Kaistia dalseonensis]MCX5493296.1 hybrid sensor histidine kinase/response regulator [Kaistia dalseonensis]MDQ0435853.1 two-component system sensor histidine kinase and response regulator WspE [Kaistia dalseonensis]
MSNEDFSQFSMLDLFKAELDTQSEALTSGLLALERDPIAADHLEACMRAAHSLKGAARIIDLAPAVRVAHAMEECLVSAQHGRLKLHHGHIDALLKGLDLLVAIASAPELDEAKAERDVDAFLKTLDEVLASEPAPPASEPPSTLRSPVVPVAEPEFDLPSVLPLVEAGDPVGPLAGNHGNDRMVRVTAESLNRLLGLAGESLMQARRIRPFSDGLLRLRRLQSDVAKSFDAVRTLLPAGGVDERTLEALTEVEERLRRSQDYLVERLAEIDALDRRATDLANRLYDETLESRMRPFEDGVRHFSRMVRDLGRALGKRVRVEIIGGSTSIDRDILDQLDAPLGHLLRNAVDHGLETPEERRRAGKAEEGVIRLEARHNAGLLQIIVADDGHGVDLDQLRTAVLDRRLITPEAATQLSEAELLEFLFLPGFSMKGTVSDISGRGVGLDAVQAMAKQVRGVASVSSTFGAGTRFQLELPLTLSVIRTLIVEVDGEPYAFPLAGIIRTLRLGHAEVEVLEGRPHFRFEGRQIGLVTAHELLERSEPHSGEGEISVVVVGEHDDAYGVIVDRFLGERELVVRPLDPRLGKVKDISAAALMEDGSPLLIIDVDDLVRSVEKLASLGRVRSIQGEAHDAGKARRKRVLVVDDSLTVRELERKLLSQHGYQVDVAVDGMDGWNAVRSDPFDLVVTDIDMPRMDGIELVTLIKKDVQLRAIPVMIVSYKDREEDRRRGLDAGADYYLTKGSFHDETLIHAVGDLIGEATE